VTLPRRFEQSSASILQKIKECLDQLNEKMEVMIELSKHGQRPSSQDGLPDVLDVMTLLSLPDHLRKTAVTLCKLEQATADEVADHTKRARAVESGYLNQLVLMGYVKKERRGRKAYFYVDRENEEKEANKPWERS
jgi:predicted transcriptional regulator